MIQNCNNFLDLKLNRVHIQYFVISVILFPRFSKLTYYGSIADGYLSREEVVWIFEDKIPAFSSMDGGEPSGGGFYAKEFPAPASTLRIPEEKPFMGCDAVSSRAMNV